MNRPRSIRSQPYPIATRMTGPDGVADPQPDHPATLPMQARPLQTLVIYDPCASCVHTTIVRRWRPGDASRCRLCAQCTAVDDLCAFVVPEVVPVDDAPLFSLLAYAVTPSLYR